MKKLFFCRLKIKPLFHSANRTLIFAGFLTLFLEHCIAPNKFAARVNGDAILNVALDKELETYISQAKTIDPQLDLDAGKIQSLRKEFLEKIIRDRVLLQSARQKGLQVSPDEAEKRLSDLKINFFQSEENLNELLKIQGLTLADYKRTLQETILMEKLIDDFVSTLSLAEDTLKLFFTSHPALFKEKTEYQAKHILIRLKEKNSAREERTALEKIKMILAKAKGGEDFAALARQYSEDGSAPSGGDLGIFQEGDMVPEFDEALRRMQPAEITGPVKTMFGLHLIQLLHKKEPAARPFEEIKDLIRDRYLDYQRQNFINGLIRSSKIQRF